MREHTFTIAMDYPGMEISKNHAWRGGNRRWGMNAVAREWRAGLADSVRMALLIDGILQPREPVRALIEGRFVDAHHAVDLHNLIELVADSVQEGTGINDRHFAVDVQPPQYDAKKLPCIFVTVTVSYDEEEARK